MTRVILALWFAIFFASADAFASSEASPFEGRHKPTVYTECKLGKWFVVAYNANSVSIMQVFQDAGDMVPKPMECGAKHIEADDED